MIEFEYFNPARIIFSTEPFDKVKIELERLQVRSLLLVYRGVYIEQFGIYDAIKNLCKQLNINFVACNKVVPNPEIELVRELVKLGKQEKIDFVMAAGGGSSIDTAKAVAMGIPYEGDVWDFFSGIDTAKNVIPIGVISTIPSSGSESSNATIITNGLSKLGYEDEKIIPQFAVLNPTYTMTVPPYQTACGVADILSHLLERYLTNVEHVDVTDYLIEGAIKALLLNGERIIEEPDNLDVRSEIQWLAALAHNNLLDTGRISDWASHRVEHELSGQYGIVHGEGMAIVFLAYLKYIAIHHPYKAARLSQRILHLDPYNYTDDQLVLKLVERLKEFFIKINLRINLSSMGIGKEHFDEMAERATCNGTMSVGHYYPLDKEKFIEVLELAL